MAVSSKLGSIIFRTLGNPSKTWLPLSSLQYQTLAADNVNTNREKDVLDYLQGCQSAESLPEGKAYHAKIIKSGQYLCMFLHTNQLISMYGKCGTLADARQVFDEMPVRTRITWNTLISLYSGTDNRSEAINFIRRMTQDPNLGFHEVICGNNTLSIFFRACAGNKALREGMQIHAMAYKLLEDFDEVLQGAILDMYCKCGRMDFASNVFDRMPHKNIISWGIMVAGLSQNRKFEDTLRLFRDALRSNVRPNEYMISAALSSCTGMSDKLLGEQFHCLAVKSMLADNLYLGSGLIHMYARCLSVENAMLVFRRLPHKNVVCLNAMVTGLNHNGLHKMSLRVFEEMLREGLKPNGYTFFSVLTACKELGLVSEARDIFQSMERDHGVTPALRDYTCMIELLRESGNLEEAEELIKAMPSNPDETFWKSLLQGSVEVDEKKPDSENSLLDQALHDDPFVTLGPAI